ncbi:MAG: hypothetical protein ACYDH9_26030 [Limisphaerales bacterium]
MDDDADAEENQFPVWKRRLIWAAIHVNMGGHIMKTTIEIADDLFERAQRIAQKEQTTFRALTEAGLRLVIAGKHRNHPRKLAPLVTFGGGGPTAEFKDWNWDRIRDEIYRGRGS